MGLVVHRRNGHAEHIDWRRSFACGHRWKRSVRQATQSAADHVTLGDWGQPISDGAAVGWWVGCMCDPIHVRMISVALGVPIYVLLLRGFSPRALFLERQYAVRQYFFG